MDSDKSTVLRAFNKLFFEFIDDIISVYPDNVEMLTARESFAMFKKLNPTSIVKVWFSGVYSKYKSEIDEGNLNFFTEKDYSVDLNSSNVNNSQSVLNMIDKSGLYLHMREHQGCGYHRQIPIVGRRHYPNFSIAV